jgi:hypothetical protein
LVKNLLLDLVNLVINGQQSLLSQSRLVLGFSLGSIVLLPPARQLSVHGVDIVVDELDRFAEGSSVLANTLDHALNEL